MIDSTHRIWAKGNVVQLTPEQPKVVLNIVLTERWETYWSKFGCCLPLPLEVKHCVNGPPFHNTHLRACPSARNHLTCRPVFLQGMVIRISGPSFTCCTGGSHPAPTDRLKPGSGYANVVPLLLCNLEDAWDRDANSANAQRGHRKMWTWLVIHLVT